MPWGRFGLAGNSSLQSAIRGDGCCGVLRSSSSSVVGGCGLSQVQMSFVYGFRWRGFQELSPTSTKWSQIIGQKNLGSMRGIVLFFSTAELPWSKLKSTKGGGELPLIKRTETLAAFPPTNTIDMIPQTLKQK